jgi:hypothetical protein
MTRTFIFYGDANNKHFTVCICSDDVRCFRISVGCVSYLWPSQEAVSHHRSIGLLRSILALCALRNGQLGGYIEHDMEFVQ